MQAMTCDGCHGERLECRRSADADAADDDAADDSEGFVDVTIKVIVATRDADDDDDESGGGERWCSCHDSDSDVCVHMFALV